jgi:hypothetical protein
MPITLESGRDRRAHTRFDVLGALWGVLELPESARILNVSGTGMLIEASSPAVLESVQTIRVLVDGEMVRFDTRVKHVHAADRAGRYVLGLEFESVPTSVLVSIEHLAATDTGIDVFQSSLPKS